MDSVHFKRTMKYSRPKFHADATLLSPVLCCKHYISMYLDEYLTKLWFSLEKILVTKNTHTPKLLGPGINMYYMYFPNIFLLLGALNARF